MIRKIYSRIEFEIRRFVSQYRKKNTHCVKWGIIGTGYMAETFAKALACHDESSLEFICSRKIEKAIAFATKHRIDYSFSSIDDCIYEMVDKVDVVYIATPLESHFAICEKFLSAGYNVICEKPITSTEAEFDILEKLATANSCFLAEGMWSLLLPPIKSALSWVNSGRIGEVYRVDIDLSKKITSPTNIHDILSDYAIYPIALGLAFCKDEKYTIDFDHTVVDGQTIHLVIRLSLSNKTVDIECSSLISGTKEARIYGREGYISLGVPFNRTNSIELYDNSNLLTESKSWKYISEGFEYEITEVNKAVKAHKLQSEQLCWKQTRKRLNMLDYVR